MYCADRSGQQTVGRKRKIYLDKWSGEVGWEGQGLIISRHRHEDWSVQADSHEMNTISPQPAERPYFWEKGKLFGSETYRCCVSDRKASRSLIYQGQRVWPGGPGEQPVVPSCCFMQDGTTPPACRERRRGSTTRTSTRRSPWCRGLRVENGLNGSWKPRDRKHLIKLLEQNLSNQFWFRDLN